MIGKAFHALNAGIGMILYGIMLLFFLYLIGFIGWAVLHSLLH